MPDKRTHRGTHPQDEAIFGADKVITLRRAVEDYSMLLSRGYAEKSSLKLVGDRFDLRLRQRTAVQRSCCSDRQLARRKAHQVEIDTLTGRPILIDGYNVLITVESALGGAFIFRGRDGCLRDLAGIHGTYRKVSETIPAVKLAAECLNRLGTDSIKWFFDRAVSNSGRLRTIIANLAGQNHWNWEIELSPDPDSELIASGDIVASSDSNILDCCHRWVNLTEYVIRTKIPSARIVDLGDS